MNYMLLNALLHLVLLGKIPIYRVIMVNQIPVILTRLVSLMEKYYNIFPGQTILELGILPTSLYIGNLCEPYHICSIFGRIFQDVHHH